MENSFSDDLSHIANKVELKTLLGPGQLLEYSKRQDSIIIESIRTNIPEALRVKRQLGSSTAVIANIEIYTDGKISSPHSVF